jgi:hypothetical protein
MEDYVKIKNNLTINKENFYVNNNNNINNKNNDDVRPNFDHNHYLYANINNYFYYNRNNNRI